MRIPSPLDVGWEHGSPGGAAKDLQNTQWARTGRWFSRKGIRTIDRGGKLGWADGSCTTGELVE
jgi:hypothetical protein